MKKTLFLLPTLLIAPILFQANQHVLAAQPTPQTTKGAVQFKEEADPLKLVTVPSFHFGIDRNYDRSKENSFGLVTSGPGHENTTITSSNVIEVLDNRAADDTKTWTLQAELAKEFVAEKATARELKGATINLPVPSVTETETGTTVAESVSIAKATSKIAESKAGSGGRAILTYAESGIELKVPQGTAVVMDDIYQADILWTLVGAPENSQPQP